MTQKKNLPPVIICYRNQKKNIRKLFDILNIIQKDTASKKKERAVLGEDRLR